MKTFFIYLNHTEVMISETNKELDARYVRYAFTEANTLNEAALVSLNDLNVYHILTNLMN